MDTVNSAVQQKSSPSAIVAKGVKNGISSCSGHAPVAVFHLTDVINPLTVLKTHWPQCASRFSGPVPCFFSACTSFQWTLLQKFQPAKSLNRSSLLHVSKGGKPQRGSKLPTAAEYEYFVDSSDPKNPRQPFLSIMMPIGKDLGLYGSYFCQIISTSCSSPELVYEITVNKTFVENSEETSKNSFSAKSGEIRQSHRYLSITELVDDVLEKAERRRQGLERAAEENADNDAEREYRDFDIRRMPEAGEGEGVPEAGEEVDHVVGQNRGEPNQEREAVPLMEAGRPNGGEEQEPTGEDRLNPRDVREIRERIRNNPDKNFLQNLGTQNENVKNVVADERKRLVCRSDDVVILFNSTGELIHWFFIQKDKMEPEEQKLLSKLRWCRRAKENNDAATETLRQFMRHVRDALDADVRE
ncbi:hypothetical protein BaRGS_00022966 [Batillaria attramentaria]|uniref:Uncharacterized protein n=1 Tax=Batillaria attramentaria TaxID=370345 RepID=A0ABD0KFL9_9CAEN